MYELSVPDYVPTIPSRSFYEANSLLIPAIPERMTEKIISSVSSTRPPNCLEGLKNWQETPNREYHQFELEGSIWTYVVDKIDAIDDRARKYLKNEVKDIIFSSGSTSKSIHEIATHFGIAKLTLTGIDPDVESRSNYRVIEHSTPDEATLAIPLPREVHDVYAFTHEFSHLILNNKIRNKFNVDPNAFYVDRQTRSDRRSWENMLNAINERFEKVTNTEDQIILSQAFGRIAEAFSKSNTWESQRLGIAKWEFDTWFIAVQLSSSFGLDKLNIKYEQELPDLINYYSFTERLVDKSEY